MAAKRKVSKAARKKTAAAKASTKRKSAAKAKKKPATKSAAKSKRKMAVAATRKTKSTKVKRKSAAKTKTAKQKSAAAQAPKRAAKAKAKAAPSTKRKSATGTQRKAAGKAKAAGAKKRKTLARASRHSSPPGSRTALQAPTRGSPAPRDFSWILHPGMLSAVDPNFRDAPAGWTRADAEALATEAGLALTEEHWEVIRVLQGCYKDEVSPRIRLLRDALEARFAGRGGMKYLFEILPGGPIAQGCELAGLKPPAGSRDPSFGSVA